MPQRTFIYLFVPLLLAACGSAAPNTGTNMSDPTTQSAIAPTDSIGTASPQKANNLLDGLAVVPANIHEVYFTDWSRIKENENLETITSQSPIDERQKLIMATNKNQAAASRFATPKFAKHADMWGWDTTDLDWEVTLISDGPPLYILKTRDDLDLAMIEANFKARDFTTSSYAGVTIYSHAMHLGADWLQASDLAILNTAIVPDRHLLVLSPAIAQVQAALDSITGKQPSLKENDAVLSTAQALGETSAATLLLGSAWCKGTDPASIVGQRVKPDVAEKLRKQLAVQSLTPYEVLGVGYRSVAGKSLGIIVMRYADAQAASTALSARQQLLEQGTSVVTQQPYSDMLKLQNATSDGANLIFTVQPRDDKPKRLFDMLLQRDLLFAAC